MTPTLAFPQAGQPSDRTNPQIYKGSSTRRQITKSRSPKDDAKIQGNAHSPMEQNSPLCLEGSRSKPTEQGRNIARNEKKHATFPRPASRTTTGQRTSESGKIQIVSKAARDGASYSIRKPYPAPTSSPLPPCRWWDSIREKYLGRNNRKSVWRLPSSTRKAKVCQE